MTSPEHGESHKVSYESIVTTEFSFQLLSRSEIINRLRSLIRSKAFTKDGSQWYEDLHDRLILMNRQPTMVATSLSNAQETLKPFLESTGYFYITGGLEGMHHLHAVEGALYHRGIDAVLMGLETPEYISKKGRKPLFTLLEKVSLWSYVLPRGSLIFVIPPKPENLSSDMYYDWLCTSLGIYGHTNVYHAVSTDEPPVLIEAKKRRAAPGNILHGLDTGNPPIHTTNLLSSLYLAGTT